MLAAILAVCAGARPATAVAETKAFDSFADLRNELLNDMGGATKRIWIVTDFFTDGELVSALYVAQYRKLDVQVLLGRAKANHYMSRLNYLKNQNIPVFLKPDSLKPGRPTAILCDDKLLLVDGELDFLAKYKKYTVETQEGDAADRFAAAFAAGANLKVPAVARQMPLVGRGVAKGRVYSPGSAGGAAMSAPTYSAPHEAGVYFYDHKRAPKPAGVPAKLPKGLKTDELERERSQNRTREPEVAAPPLPGDDESPGSPMKSGPADTKDGG